MEKHKTIIEPPASFAPGLGELWQFRELLYFFTWRDIKVKYKQTALGILWALIQPISLMLLFTFIFSRNLKIETGEMPYEVFVFSGLLLWNLFYGSVANASESILGHASMIRKIYFPRILIPASSLVVALFDFCIAFLVFMGFCLVTGQTPDWSALIRFPAAILMVVVSAFGIGSFLSALNVRYRDFRYVVPFMLQFLFFASQVVYPLKSIEQNWLKYLLALNPVNGAIEIFRSGFTGEADMMIIWIGVFASFFFAIFGFIYFKKAEAGFADLA
ncbi:MAG: ABC transporter permease [Flavisolibacter sp.]